MDELKRTAAKLLFCHLVNLLHARDRKLDGMTSRMPGITQLSHP